MPVSWDKSLAVPPLKTRKRLQRGFNLASLCCGRACQLRWILSCPTAACAVDERLRWFCPILSDFSQNDPRTVAHRSGGRGVCALLVSSVFFLYIILLLLYYTCSSILYIYILLLYYIHTYITYSFIYVYIRIHFGSMNSLQACMLSCWSDGMQSILVVADLCFLMV